MSDNKPKLIERARLKNRGNLQPQKGLTGKTFAVLDLEEVVIDEGTEDERTFFATTISLNGSPPEKFAVGGALILDMLRELEAGRGELPVWATQTTIKTRRGAEAYQWELHEEAEAAAILKRKSP